ncbi:MAG: UDP-N-acetylglucosamine 2-epimerase (non-hydrolyzing) [Erysipelotrichia bacterium]|jgi:UDP-N-acetylglucosamine 2-epimerase (non-hydrolysing)|nr:UDP-N-acetylglucosamine 2-epimerase (non-hydrolyzing) [Erysipelotrichia bacterium]
MKNKLKVMTILGTRPEIIRLSEVIKACDKYFDHILVHTGQNYDYELNQIFFEDLSLRAPDYYLDSVGKHLGETIGNVIAKSYELMEKVKPEAVLILGDTNSSLAAISAKRLKIPLFHMEAGNRCWDWNVPEMVNRTIVDRISDINLPYTENSRRYLLSEGMDGKTIFVTGSPMNEVITSNIEKIKKSNILQTLNLEANKYIVISAHREENIDLKENLSELVKTINLVAEKYKVPVIFSTHPRTRKRIEQEKITFNPLIQNIKPLNFSDYVKLQSNSLIVLSDSGTLTEESALLNFPAVLIRTSTERPEGLDAGTIVIGGIKSKDVLESCELAIESVKRKSIDRLPSDYETIDVSFKVTKIIQSHTHIVNKITWLK